MKFPSNKDKSPIEKRGQDVRVPNLEQIMGENTGPQPNGMVGGEAGENTG